MENIMDKISRTAVDTYHSAVKATGKLAREIRLKTQMSENKRKIQEIYEDIGKTIYEKYLLKEEINPEADLLNPCSRIDTLADEIDAFRMELLKLKDLKQCPECHYEIYYDFHYCPNCGYIQEQLKEAKQNDGPATIVTTDEEDQILKQPHSKTFHQEQKIDNIEILDENNILDEEDDDE
ncbi:MAG: hypothetical protein HFJ29_09995 [Clostridia bacterium]|nr:hypothetical protein [Clostridia bacterium]